MRARTGAESTRSAECHSSWLPHSHVIVQALLLLAHLLRNGSDRVVDSVRDHLGDLRALERFEYTDVKGKDQGINGTAMQRTKCKTETQFHAQFDTR